jgi:23S rRNA pseudouridine1911/1915/1917 synthase
MSDADGFTLRVAPSDEGKRLDVFLSARLESCSRSHAAHLIGRDFIRVNRTGRKPGYRLKPGDVVTGSVPAPEPSEYLPEPIPLDIVYEDDQIIVVNKPAGLVVHPAPGNETGTLVNALLNHCSALKGIGGHQRPGIVHRLDKDTSGILVVAKTAAAHTDLSQQFKQRAVRKTYLALVSGTMDESQGLIDLPIGRHPQDRKRMSTFSHRPRTAETGWRLRESFNGCSLLEVNLKTGRTHQIRVHFSAIHHPIVGDPVYGPKRRKSTAGAFGWSKTVAALLSTAERQMLHAWRLACRHPVTGKRHVFESPLPPDILAILEALRQLYP